MAARPNFVFMLVDAIGSGDLSCYGNLDPIVQQTGPETRRSIDLLRSEVERLEREDAARSRGVVE